MTVTISDIQAPGITAILLHPSLSRHRSRSRDSSLSIDDLSAALDLTSSEIRDDKDLLKGVVRFGNINVSAIMCPRMDVTALDIQKGFHSNHAGG
ncbi:MAG: hypothetical protein MZV63_54450 [Marinilabiliales bacterium]|nr:hypothetical protein [Marinilabiliales bacterium]